MKTTTTSVIDSITAKSQTLTVRVATLEDQLPLEEFTKSFPPVLRSFPHVWRRFGGWEKCPPYIVVDSSGKIVGFHAAMFLVKDYVNSYYLGVAPEMKGCGLGGALFWRVVQEAKQRGLTRFTNRCLRNNAGLDFYRGFGLQPIGHVDGKDFLFDWDFSGVPSLESLAEYALNETIYTKPPKRRFNAYMKDEKLQKRIDETRHCYFLPWNVERVLEEYPA